MAAIRKAFVVPAGTGQFAPEIAYANSKDTAQNSPVSLVQVIAEGAGLAAANADLQLLRPGGVPATDADWVTYKSFTLAAGGCSDVFEVLKMAVRLKLRSGGTGGTVTASLAWLP